MHKGIIMLTGAKSPEEAKANVIGYLDNMPEYELYDWYKIGGRWSKLFSEQEDLALPANDERVLNKLKEWKQDPAQEAEEAWDKMLKAREEELEDTTKHHMSAYHAIRFAKWSYDEINHDTNVFEIDGQSHYWEDKHLPNQYAVIVDIHF